MKKAILTHTLIILLLIMTSCSNDNPTNGTDGTDTTNQQIQEYDGNFFSINYPTDWEIRIPTILGSENPSEDMEDIRFRGLNGESMDYGTLEIHKILNTTINVSEAADKRTRMMLGLITSGDPTLTDEEGKPTFAIQRKQFGNLNGIYIPRLSARIGYVGYPQVANKEPIPETYFFFTDEDKRVIGHFLFRVPPEKEDRRDELEKQFESIMASMILK